MSKGRKRELLAKLISSNPSLKDGSMGQWTSQEEDENIFMINQRTGKKYKINLTEV